MRTRRKVGILISGRGSNMAALIAATQAHDYPAEIALVVSNKATALGLERARAAGVPTITIDHRGFSSREAFDDAIHAALVAAGCDLVALAGFMRIQSDAFVGRWLGRQINIHPSLLPAFKGLHPHKQALDAGVCLSGATVHFVTPELDGGPIIMQAAVPVLSGDTVESLERRILNAEHVVYPAALAAVARDAVRLSDGRVIHQADPPNLTMPPPFLWPPLSR